MSVQFRKGKKPGKEAHRILRLETEQALIHLDQFEQDQATHIHKARRSFKRIRSLLRLIRPADPYAYAVENRFFRELSRSLSAARDRDAALEIAKYLQDNQPSGSRSESAFLLQRLIKEAQRLRASVDPAELQNQVFTATKQLMAAQRRYKHLTFHALTLKKLRKAVSRTMRHVRQSYRSASASGFADDLHELRKRTKYAVNQMAICALIEPAYTPQLQAQMQQLASVLGKHQDLCVVGAILPARLDTLHVDDPLQSLSSLIESKKQELRQQSLAQAHYIMAGAGETRLRIASSGSARHSA